MAYTYLIGWSKHKKYYYGVRFSKKSDPKELWVTYFTSSKYVKRFSHEFGDPDIIQIRKIFDNVSKARLWENKVLTKMNVVNDEKWLNKTNNKSIDPVCAARGAKKHIGMKRTEKTKQKMRGPKSEQHKMNMRGKRPHVNQSGKNNNAYNSLVGKLKTKEHKEKNSFGQSKIIWTIISPDNQKFVIKNLNNFCKEQNLSISSLWYTAKTKKPNKDGWQCYKDSNRFDEKVI